MKCITYGWVIVFLILLSVIVGVLAIADQRIAGVVYGLGFVGIHVWWLLGWFSDCPSGYLGNLVKRH